MRFLSFILLSSVIFFCSCTKTINNPVPTPITDTLIIKDTVFLKPLNPIVGLWIGTQNPNDGSTNVPLYYSFDIRTDDSILVQGLGADGNTYYLRGTWVLSGTSFTATVTVTNLSLAGVSQSLSATYNSTGGTLTNGLVQTINVPYTASFTMYRVN